MCRVLQEISIVCCLCKVIEVFFLFLSQCPKGNSDQVNTVLLQQLVDYLLCILGSFFSQLVCKVNYVPEVFICIFLESAGEKHLLALNCISWGRGTTITSTIPALLEFFHCLYYCLVHIGVLCALIRLNAIDLISQLSEILLFGY